MFLELQSRFTIDRGLLAYTHCTEYNSPWNGHTCTSCPSLHPSSLFLLVPFVFICSLPTFMSYLPIFFNLYCTDESRHCLSLSTIISGSTPSSLDICTVFFPSFDGHLRWSHVYCCEYCWSWVWYLCVCWLLFHCIFSQWYGCNSEFDFWGASTLVSIVARLCQLPTNSLSHSHQHYYCLKKSSLEGCSFNHTNYKALGR